MKKKSVLVAFAVICLFLILIQTNKYIGSNMSKFNNSEHATEGQALQNINMEHNQVAEPIQKLMGKKTKEVIAILGDPERIDYSEYDYEWWIYNENLDNYLQVGVDNDRVVTIFVMGEDINIAPFKIGQSYGELAEFTEIEEQIAFQVDDNPYRFELNKEDMDTAPLVNYNGTWAQVFIDKFTSEVSSIRFTDTKTLVKIRPYELVYRGTLFTAKEIDLNKWEEIEKGKSRQILDMTNIIRKRNGLQLVEWDEKTADVAYSHSREMFEQEYFSHSSPKNGGLSDRLLKGGVMFKIAGENIAARYVDAISAVEGWLNSEGHRRTLLNDRFTHLGVGVYEKYYTQNFIQAVE